LRHYFLLDLAIESHLARASPLQHQKHPVMKTTITTRVIALAMLVLPTEFQAQATLLCMHEKKTSEVTLNSVPAQPIEDTAIESIGSLEFSEVNHRLSYRLPAKCEIASILVLKATGEVVAECPVTISDENTINESILRTADLPAGRYYITLLADYAVVDSKQFIKVQ
jgi:hypothetical protein